MFHVSAYLFYVGFVLGMFCVCHWFAFICFLFAFRLSEKYCFPCHSSVFELYWLNGCLLFMLHVLVLAFCSCVACFHSKNEVVLLYVCVVCLFCNKTKWFSCLHRVVLFLFCCFVLKFFIHQNRQKSGHSKNPQKSKLQRKGTLLSVSAVVFTNSVPNFGGWA